jgi:N-acetylneuraminate synthase
MTFSVNGREINSRTPPYIIAEISANHNGSIQRALDTMKAAKQAGVDAIKIQTYTPDTMTIDSRTEDFLLDEGIWKGRYLYDLYSESYTPFEWHKTLFQYADELGITLFSSPFDESAVDLLYSLNAPAYKVASFEIIDLPLIKYIAEKKRPIFMSTGMASIKEIRAAINTAQKFGCEQIAIFNCTSSYPTRLDEANINAITKLKEEFGVEVGLSDHTIGNIASIVATSLGATIIEKHFTRSRSDGGVDSSFSLEPNEMKALVEDTKSAHLALGSGRSIRSPAERKNCDFRRSLYFVTDVEFGEQITEMHVKRIRPGLGLEPKYYPEVIGSICLKEAKRGDRVTFDHFRTP